MCLNNDATNVKEVKHSFLVISKINQIQLKYPLFGKHLIIYQLVYTNTSRSFFVSFDKTQSLHRCKCGHNILRRLDILLNFALALSEMKYDY